MPYDILEPPALDADAEIARRVMGVREGFEAGQQPESGGFEVLSEQGGFDVIDEAAPEAASTLGGIAGSVKRGFLGGQRALAAAQMPPAGVTIPQGRTAFTKAMSDPAYMASLMEAGDDPERLRMAESLRGPARRLDLMRTPITEGRAALAGDIAESTREMEAIPRSEAMARWEAADNSNWWKVLAADPVEITANIFAESLPQAAVSMGGALAGGPAGAGAGSYAVETANAMVQAAADAGVDLRDEKQVRDFFSDPQKQKAALAFATARGLPIAALDAVSAGIAGRFLRPALGQGFVRVAGATGRELGAQAALGAGGETAAELGTGQALSAKDIVAEAVGELATAPGEIVSNLGGELNGRPAGQKPPVQPLTEKPKSPEPAAPATLTPEALADLQAVMRGERPESGRLKQPNVQRPTSNVPPAETKKGENFPGESEADARIRAMLADRNKDYSGMSGIELELLEAMGDTGARSERKARQVKKYLEAESARSEEARPADAPVPESEPPTPDSVRSRLRQEGVSHPNIEALLSGAKTIRQVVHEQLERFGRSVDEQLAGLGVSPGRIEQQTHAEALREAAEEAVIRLHAILESSPPAAGTVPEPGRRAIATAAAATADEEAAASKPPPAAGAYAGILEGGSGQRYSIADAASDAGGVGAPPLDDALAQMASGRRASQVVADWSGGRGEYDGLADILEQLRVAAEGGRQHRQFRDLAAAYRRAFREGESSRIDQTFAPAVDKSPGAAQAPGRELPRTAPERAFAALQRAIDRIWPTRGTALRVVRRSSQTGERVSPGQRARERAWRAFEKVFRRRIVEVETADGSSLPFQGVTLSGHERTLFLNTQRANTEAVLGHEFLESLRLENPALYERLRRDLLPLLAGFPEYRAKLNALERGHGIEESGELDAQGELIADFVGDCLADESFLKRLRVKSPGLFNDLARALLDFLRGVKAKLTAYGAGQYFSDVTAAENRVMAALEEHARGEMSREFYGKNTGSVTEGEPRASVQPEGFSFDAPETVEEQKERREREQAQAETSTRQQAQRDELSRKRDRRLAGDLGDAGQGGLFAEEGQQEMFKPNAGGVIEDSEPRFSLQRMERPEPERDEASFKNMKPRILSGAVNLDWLPDDLVLELRGWQVVSKSPWSNSFYDITNKTWGEDPEGFLRVSDHWNWVDDDGRQHARTDKPVNHGDWTLAKYDADAGEYRVLKTFPDKGRSELERTTGLTTEQIAEKASAVLQPYLDALEQDRQSAKGSRKRTLTRFHNEHSFNRRAAIDKLHPEWPEMVRDYIGRFWWGHLSNANKFGESLADAMAANMRGGFRLGPIRGLLDFALDEESRQSDDEAWQKPLNPSLSPGSGGPLETPERRRPTATPGSSQQQASSGSLPTARSETRGGKPGGQDGEGSDFRTLDPRFSLSPGERDALADEYRTVAQDLRDVREEIRAARADGGEPTPEQLDRLQAAELRLIDLEEQMRAPRHPGGIPAGLRGVAVDANLRPRGAGAGGAPGSPFAGDERLPSGRLRDLLGGLRSWRRRTGNWLSRRFTRADITVGRDAGDNRAAQVANEAANSVRLRLNRAFGDTGRAARRKHDLREYALTFVVEADGDRAALAEFRDAIAGSEHAVTKHGRRALKAIDLAESEWARFEDAAEQYRLLSESEREIELNEGVNSHEWQGGYVFHQWARDTGDTGGADPTKPQPAGTPFRKPRSVATYAEGIAEGRVPVTLNALENLAGRMDAGQKRLNELRWVHGLRQLTDPVTGEPVVVDVIRKPRRPPGTPRPESGGEPAPDDFSRAVPPEWVTTAPPGYRLFRSGDLEVAAAEGFHGLLGKLTSPSFFKGSTAKKAFGLAKSVLLLFDTFHLGRLAAWRTMFGLGGGYRKGVTLLDYTATDLREMAQRGEIPEAWVEALTENKRRIDLAVQAGFNVGNVLDNAWGDALHHLPGIGTFNKWLFGQYQRGAMTEAWLIEFERNRRARPGESETTTARRVSRDLNARFGNLNRQGWFKSRTAQDLVRFVFLAPQWNESLIRSELGAVRDLLRLPVDSARQRRLVVGTLLKATGTMAVGTFLAGQVLNFIFRGKPTWENEEEGWDKKLSAYIPDVVGGGPGFFLNPLALPAEYTHLIDTQLHKSRDSADAAWRILNSRLSNPSRALLTLATRRDVLGRAVRPGEVTAAMGQALTPLPIPTSTITGVAKQIATGEPGERYAGQFQKQALSSFGVKTDQAPTPEQRIRTLARDFNKTKGITPSAEFYAGDYDDFTKALRLGNRSDARDALAELLQKKTARQVYDHYKRWMAAPYTGQRAREGEFLRGLTPEQRSAYEASRAARRALAREAAALLKGAARPAPVR